MDVVKPSGSPQIINAWAKDNGLSAINLNLGCGGRPLKGWINIDNYDFDPRDTSRSGSVYDIKMDIRTLQVEDDSVNSILLVHVLEHFVRWETFKMLAHFYTKLLTGGKLIVEMPDLDRCIALYLKGKEAPHMNTPLGSLNMGFTQFYGNQWSELDYETHRYVWTTREFVMALESIGFRDISVSHDAKFHMKGRDMFVVAVK
jgi:predicted SAM-dependent methyltransferase